MEWQAGGWQLVLAISTESCPSTVNGFIFCSECSYLQLLYILCWLKDLLVWTAGSRIKHRIAWVEPAIRCSSFFAPFGMTWDCIFCFPQVLSFLYLVLQEIGQRFMFLSKPKIIAYFHPYQIWECSDRREWPKPEHPLWSWERELR